MDPVNILYKSWENESAVFEKNLTRLKTRLTVKLIHDIRVCIKKLKAYRRLYYLLEKSDETKLKLKETNNLFDTSGRMRNIQICISQLKKYEKANNCVLTGFRQYLSFKLKQSNEWTRQVVKQYKTNELPAFGNRIKKVSAGDTQEHFIQRILKIINALFHEVLKSTDHPHQVRILLKRIYYWLKILPAETAIAEYNLEKIDLVMTLLGEWQDAEILLAETKYFRKQVIPVSVKENDLLKNLSTGLKSKKKLICKDALSGISELKR